MFSSELADSVYILKPLRATGIAALADVVEPATQLHACANTVTYILLYSHPHFCVVHMQCA